MDKRLKVGRRFLLAGGALCGFTACVTSTAVPFDYGGKTPDTAADASTSPITIEQAVAIAHTAVDEREHWPEEKEVPRHITHTVFYSARRINHGCWRVVAHRAIKESPLGGGGAVGYDSVPPAVVVVNKDGKMISYSRVTTDFFDE